MQPSLSQKPQPSTNGRPSHSQTEIWRAPVGASNCVRRRRILNEIRCCHHKSTRPDGASHCVPTEHWQIECIFVDERARGAQCKQTRPQIWGRLQGIYGKRCSLHLQCAHGIAIKLLREKTKKKDRAVQKMNPANGMRVVKLFNWARRSPSGEAIQPISIYIVRICA